MKINILISIVLFCLLINTISAATGDVILFEEVNVSKNVTQVWNNGTLTIKPIIQGITSTNNTDISKTGGNNDGASGFNTWKYAQGFTPTKSQLTNVSVNLKNTGTTSGTLTISVVPVSTIPTESTVLAQNTIPISALSSSYVWYSIPVPCVVTTGQIYAVVIISSTGDGAGVTWDIKPNGGVSGEGDWYAHAGNNDWTDAYPAQLDLITYYGENAEAVNVTVNSNKMTLDTGDATGLLSGATLYTSNNTFEYNNGFNASVGKFSDVYSATTGGFSGPPVVINGWGWNNTAESIQSASDTSARSITFKINTVLPVTGLNVTATGFNNNVNTGLVELSGDGSTFVTIWDLPASASAQTNTISTGEVNGNNTIYVRLSKDTTNGYIRWDDLKVKALVNTSTIQTPALTYIDGENTINLTSYGNSVNSSLDPSLRANVWIVEGSPSVLTPVVQWITDKLTIVFPGKIMMNETFIRDGIHDPTSWNYTPGDGKVNVSLNQRNVSYQYVKRGVWTACLNVSNSAGFNESCKSIRVIGWL